MTAVKFPSDQADYWRDLDLPDCWPDNTSVKMPLHLLHMFWRLRRGKVARVELPEQLPGMSLPKYLLQEFHSLPNGNYSKHIAAGYAHSFDAVMLNTVKRRRQEMARRFFAHVERALDIGCGGGHMVQAQKNAGIQEVWGLEPSPYLLQLAARENPKLKLIQGIAESIPMPDQSMELVTACFIFHHAMRIRSYRKSIGF